MKLTSASAEICRVRTDAKFQFTLLFSVYLMFYHQNPDFFEKGTLKNPRASRGALHPYWRWSEFQFTLPLDIDSPIIFSVNFPISEVQQKVMEMSWNVMEKC